MLVETRSNKREDINSNVVVVNCFSNYNSVIFLQSATQIYSFDVPLDAPQQQKSQMMSRDLIISMESN